MLIKILESILKLELIEE